MKISAIPQGGISQGNIGSDRTASPEKLAIAKQIAAGESPIRVTESDNYIDPQVQKAQESIRRIKMRTNVSPDRFDPTQEQVEAESALSDATGQAEATVEATQPLSPQFAALAKQKRALQVKERELADREKALSGQQPKNGSDDLVARLKSQPLSVLQEHGVTYDQLTEAILANQGGNSELIALKAEIKALKEGVDKQFSDKDLAQEQAVLAEMRREAQVLAASGDAYEMVRETGSIDDVMTLIHRTYKETGEVLDTSEALQLVEDELINESLKIANINKVKSRLTPAQVQQVQQQQQVRTMRTLTARDTAKPTMTARERALAAFHGTLKK